MLMVQFTMLLLCCLSITPNVSVARNVGELETEHLSAVRN